MDVVGSSARTGWDSRQRCASRSLCPAHRRAFTAKKKHGGINDTHARTQTHANTHARSHEKSLKSRWHGVIFWVGSSSSSMELSGGPSLISAGVRLAPVPSLTRRSSSYPWKEQSLHLSRHQNLPSNLRLFLRIFP